MRKFLDFCHKHRNNVDFVALGAAMVLGTLGFGLMGALAFLKHDWILGSMVIAAIVILFIALIPAYRLHKLTNRMAK